MGSSFFFELPVYVNEASLKGGKYTLPGTVLSPEVVQTSNSMSYHRNRQAQYLESDSNSESSLLDTNNASSVLDHQNLTLLSTYPSNQSQMNLLNLWDSQSSLNGLSQSVSLP